MLVDIQTKQLTGSCHIAKIYCVLNKEQELIFCHHILKFPILTGGQYIVEYKLIYRVKITLGFNKDLND